MTQDKIIRMARKAGAEFAELPMMDAIVFSVDDREWNSAELMRFAALVAAHEREKLKNVAIFSKWYEELDKAVLAEREACAKVCESMYNSPTFSDEYIECADAIRARSNYG